MKLRTKIRCNAPVTLAIFLASLAALVLDRLTGGAANRALFSVYRSSPASPMTYARLVCHIFGHAGMDHFFGNMLLILAVGTPLEELRGSRCLAVGTIATALATGLLHIALCPGKSLLGASGIAFMFIMLAACSGAKSDRINVTTVLTALLYLSKEMYALVFVDSGVSNFAHIIGGLCGIIIGVWAMPDSDGNGAGSL